MSLDNNLIAARYVRALFGLAAEQDAHDQVKKDMLAMRSVLAQSQELQRLLVNPVISRDQMEKAVQGVLTAIKAGELTRKFFTLLVRQRRLALTGAAIDAYLQMLAESRGEVAVQVISAQELGKDQIKILTQALDKATGKKVNLETKENPALIGGVQIRIGSRMLDHSIAGKLARLRLALTKAA